MEEQTFYTHNSLHFKFIFTRIDCLQHLARNIRALDGLIKRRILNFSLERKKEKKILESFFSKNPIKREKKRERERYRGKKERKKREKSVYSFRAKVGETSLFARQTSSGTAGRPLGFSLRGKRRSIARR